MNSYRRYPLSNGSEAITRLNLDYALDQDLCLDLNAIPEDYRSFQVSVFNDPVAATVFCLTDSIINSIPVYGSHEGDSDLTYYSTYCSRNPEDGSIHINDGGNKPLEEFLSAAGDIELSMVCSTIATQAALFHDLLLHSGITPSIGFCYLQARRIHLRLESSKKPRSLTGFLTAASAEDKRNTIRQIAKQAVELRERYARSLDQE